MDRNYKVRGAPITPRDWMGVNGMDLDHKMIQNIHINTFLMWGQIVLSISLEVLA